MVNFKRIFPTGDIGGAIGSVFDSAKSVVNGSSGSLPGFDAPPQPSASGFATRQSRIPSGRTGRHVRNMVRFFVPETGIVEMYINPQSIKYTDKKHISQVRTKGGYTLQYWGEELGSVSVNGNTGSSGVEGINVLYDVYRNEQVSFDPYALALASARDQQTLADSLSASDSSIGNVFGNIASTGLDAIQNQVQNVLDSGNTNPTRPKPTLASLAFQTEMYWSGWVFRGYFMNFSVDEKAGNIGLFDYSFEFVVTQKRGLRSNFFAWHRSATSGPSNSSSERLGGVPHTYAARTNYGNQPAVNQELLNNSGTTSIDNGLSSDRPIVGDGVRR